MVRCHFLVFIATLCCTVRTQPQQQQSSLTQGNVKELSSLVNQLGTSVSDVVSEILNQQFSLGSMDIEVMAPSLAAQIGGSVGEVIMQYSNVINFEGIDLNVLMSSIIDAVEMSLTSTSFDQTQDTDVIVKQITNTVLRNIGAALMSVSKPPVPPTLSLPLNQSTTNDTIENVAPTQETSANVSPENVITAIQENKITEVVQGFKSMRNESEFVTQGLTEIVCATEDEISVQQAGETLQAMISNEMIDLVAEMLLAVTQSGNLCNLPQILYNWLLSEEALVRIQLSLPIEDIIAAQGCGSTIFGLLDEVRIVAQSSGQLQRINKDIDTIMPSIKNCSQTQPELVQTDVQTATTVVASPLINEEEEEEQQQGQQIETPAVSQFASNDVQQEQLLFNSPLPFSIGSGLPIPTIPPLTPLQDIAVQSSTLLPPPLSPPTIPPPPQAQQEQLSNITKQQQSFIWSSNGSRIMVGECFDIPPPGQYTCAEEAAMGKCSRQWMVDGVLCAKTCGICDTCIDIQPDETTSCQQAATQGLCNSQLFIEQGFCKQACGNCETPLSLSSTPAPIPAVSPVTSVLVGSPKIEFKVPETQIMDGNQRMQTGHQGVNMVQQAAASYKECTDIPPDTKFTCQEQKQLGKCNYAWMLDQNYCQISCGRCGKAAVEEAQKMISINEQFLAAVIQEITQSISNDTSVCFDGQKLYPMVEDAIRRGFSS